MAVVGVDHLAGDLRARGGERGEVERLRGPGQGVDVGGVAEVGQHAEHRHPALVPDLGGVLGDEGRVVLPGDVDQHHPEQAKPGVPRRLDGERGVADRPQAGQRRDHHLGVEAAQQVADRLPPGERDQQPTHALDQEEIAARRGRLGRPGEGLDVQLPSLRGRRRERRPWQFEGCEHGRTARPRDPPEQLGVLAHPARRDAGRHRLERAAVDPAPAQRGAEGRGEHRLAHPGPGAGHRDDPSHQTSSRDRIAAATPSISASEWAALATSRSRLVPGSTVGGRTPWTR